MGLPKPHRIWMAAIALSVAASAFTTVCSAPTNSAHPSRSVSLPQVVRLTMANYFAQPSGKALSNENLLKSLPVSTQYRQPVGVFVTLSKNGKTRACWGDVFPKSRNVVQSTVEATLGALTKEYRHPPIRRWEWRSLKPQVTVIRRLEPVGHSARLNPMRDGLMVRSGGKSGVLLPGEAGDAHYQIVQCKLKAGIRPGEPYQMYRMEADVYR